MKMKELENLTVEELAVKEKEIKKELYALNNQRQIGRIEKPALFKRNKKNIARILTVINAQKSKNKK